MTFEEWKEKHNELIENVTTLFFNYERGVDTKTCYDELEYLLKKVFISGQHNCNRVHTDNSKVIEELEKENAETDLATVAYMQGAERYKPKWHEVADGDLPEDNRNVLVATIADVYEGFYENGFWYGAGGGKLRVIAWCEIPKYKEELS